MSETNEINISLGNDTVRIEFTSGNCPVDMNGIREKESDSIGRALLKAASMLDKIAWLDPTEPYNGWTVSRTEQKLTGGKSVIGMTLCKVSKEYMFVETTHFDINGSLYIFRLPKIDDFQFVLSVLPGIYDGYLAMRNQVAVGMVKAAKRFLDETANV